MSRQTIELLERLSSEEQTPIIRRLRAVLVSPQARITVQNNDGGFISDLEPTWRVRQKVAQAKKKRIFGLPGLLAQLRISPPDRRVHVIGVIDERESGTLFFDAQDDHFLGAVVVVMSNHTKAYYNKALDFPPFERNVELARTA